MDDVYSNFKEVTKPDEEGTDFHITLLTDNINPEVDFIAINGGGGLKTNNYIAEYISANGYHVNCTPPINS